MDKFRYVFNLNDNGIAEIVAESFAEAVEKLKKEYEISDDWNSAIKSYTVNKLILLPEGKESLEDVKDGEFSYDGEVNGKESIYYEYGTKFVDEENYEFHYRMTGTVNNGKVTLDCPDRLYEEDYVVAKFTDEQMNELTRIVQGKYEEYIGKKHNPKGYDR